MKARNWSDEAPVGDGKVVNAVSFLEEEALPFSDLGQEYATLETLTGDLEILAALDAPRFAQVNAKREQTCDCQCGHSLSCL